MLLVIIVLISGLFIRSKSFWKYGVLAIIYSQLCGLMLSGRGTLENPTGDGLITRLVRETTGDGPFMGIWGLMVIVIAWLPTLLLLSKAFKKGLATSKVELPKVFYKISDDISKPQLERLEKEIHWQSEEAEFNFFSRLGTITGLLAYTPKLPKDKYYDFFKILYPKVETTVKSFIDKEKDEFNSSIANYSLNTLISSIEATMLLSEKYLENPRETSKEDLIEIINSIKLNALRDRKKIEVLDSDESIVIDFNLEKTELDHLDMLLNNKRNYEKCFTESF